MKRLVFYTMLFAGLGALAFAAQQGKRIRGFSARQRQLCGRWMTVVLRKIVPADPATQGSRCVGEQCRL